MQEKLEKTFSYLIPILEIEISKLLGLIYKKGYSKYLYIRQIISKRTIYEIQSQKSIFCT